MALELYYTSAPTGLRPNTRGFCTVAASSTLPRGLAERLETLSTYRHLGTGTNNGPSAMNPTALAHWLLTYSGREYHVLSRISDSGLDYTQRTNYFAHHIVLEPSELLTPGPAWLLAQPKLTSSSWNGQIGDLPANTTLQQLLAITPSAAHTGPAQYWQRVTGDAGWAGVLAETLIKQPHKGICLLIPRNLDLLPLFAEAIALLPPAQRWLATFNTYFTSLPPGVSCGWRGCLADSPAAAQAQRTPNTLVLNLIESSQLPTISPSPWVTYARTGQKPAELSATRNTISVSVTPPVSPALPSVPGKYTLAAQEPSTSVTTPPHTEIPTNDSYELAPIPNSPTSVPPMESPVPAIPTPTRIPGMLVGTAPTHSQQDWFGSEPATSNRYWIWLVLGIFVAVAVILGVFFKMHAPPPPPTTVDITPMQTTIPTTAATRSTETVPTEIVTTAAIKEHSAATAPSPITVIIEHPTTNNGNVSTRPHTAPSISIPLLPTEIKLTDPLVYPLQNTGLTSNLVQSFKLETPNKSLTATSLLRPAHNLALVFPGKDSKVFRYQSTELTGELIQTSNSNSDQTLSVSLAWKTTAEPSPRELATITLDKVHNELQISWQSTKLTSPERAQAAQLVYWVLQHTKLLIQFPEHTGQSVNSVTLTLPPGNKLQKAVLMSLELRQKSLDLPAHLPPGTVFKITSNIPETWMTALQDETTEKNKNKNKNNSEAEGLHHILYVSRKDGEIKGGSLNDGGDWTLPAPWFLISFTSDYSHWESTYSQNIGQILNRIEDIKDRQNSVHADIRKLQDQAQELINTGSLRTNVEAKLKTDLVTPNNELKRYDSELASCQRLLRQYQEIGNLEAVLLFADQLPLVHLHIVLPNFGPGK